MSLIWRWDLAKLPNRTIRTRTLCLENQSLKSFFSTMKCMCCVHTSIFMRMVVCLCLLMTYVPEYALSHGPLSRRMHVDPTVPLRWQMWVKEGIEAVST